MRRLLLSILLLALPFIANAETAQIEGIWYEMIADIKEAKVIKDPNTSLINGNYNGDVVIPEKISFNGVEYSVISETMSVDELLSVAQSISVETVGK